MDSVSLKIIDLFLLKWDAIGPFKEQSLVNFDVQTRFNQSGNNGIEVRVDVGFRYPDIKEPVIKCATITIFEVLNEKGERISTIQEDQLPDSIFISMLSISISHARALIAERTKAAGMSGFLLPIANPTDIFNRMKQKSAK